MTATPFTELPLAFWVGVAAITGAVVGSFLNVVIHRLPKMLERRWEAEARAFLASQGEEAAEEQADAKKEAMEEAAAAAENASFNLAVPASHCPHCGARLRWFDNVPILSWLLLRGRCRRCQEPIPFRYLLVELLSALLTGATIAHFGPTPKGAAALLLVWALLALAFIDWETQLLPDDLTLPLLWLGLLVNLAGLFVPLPQAVIGAMVGYLALYTLYWAFKWLTGKEGMGYGDFKLLAALGAWFGAPALPEVVLASSLLGAIVGVAARLTGRLAAGQPIPFGPFLVLGGLFVLFFPGRLVALILGSVPL